MSTSTVSALECFRSSSRNIKRSQERDHYRRSTRTSGLPWQQQFTLDAIELGTRHASFLLAYYSWRWLPQMLGPSFGLAFQGALRRIQKEKLAGTLDNLRRDGKVEVIILGADTYLPYLELFLGETQSDERHTYKTPDLLALAI